jgi:phosphoribosylanthranilate isomerase
MIAGIRFKVCGLTSLVDAEAADRCGADYLGFILHPLSPRRVTLEQFRAMAGRLPDRKKVAVAVEPTAEELKAIKEAGFDSFQLHVRTEIEAARLAEWRSMVAPQNLWLAPKLPPERDVPTAMLAVADNFVLDTYHAGGFGGSGQIGDWGKFARHRTAHPGKNWILAGGLNAANVAEALAQSGARFVDVNSGVESAPGVKDAAKLEAFAAALRQAAGAKVQPHPT